MTRPAAKRALAIGIAVEVALALLLARALLLAWPSAHYGDVLSPPEEEPQSSAPLAGP